MAPVLPKCARLGCGRKIPYKGRKERVGSNVFGQRVSYYVKAYGGTYSPDDIFCVACVGKVFDHCKITGALEEIKQHQAENQATDQNQVRNVEMPHAVEHPADMEQATDLRQAENFDKDDNLQRDDNLDRAENLERVENLDRDENLERVENLDRDENLEREDNLDRDENLHQDGYEMEVDEGQTFEVNSETYSARNNVEACYSDGSFFSEPIRSSRRNISQDVVACKDIVSVPKTENQCLICKMKSPEGRRIIPDSVRMQVWRSEQIYIPKQCRCCKTHIDGGKFNEDAIEVIRSKGKLGTRLDEDEVTGLVFYLTKQLNSKDAFLNFDDPNTPESAYLDMLGMTKSNFEHFYTTFVSQEQNLLNSKNRSKRNALAIFLVKLRLGVSQKVIGRLFGITSQPIICMTIKQVAIVLNESFLPFAEGFTHITREEIIATHQPGYVRKLFNVPLQNICLVLDGTYLDVYKPYDFDMQKRTYCAHKKKNLVKPMMIVTPDGYIVCAEGPYFSDGQNNDARILSDMLDRDQSIRTLVRSGDHFLMDRGFPTVTAKLDSFGITYSLPENLEKKQKQLTTEQANASRRVTLCRWVVEAANGRLKNLFDFFEHRIPCAYLGKLRIPESVTNHGLCQLGIMFKIACGIVNQYHPPLFTETSKHEKILEVLNSRHGMSNLLALKVKELDLHKKRYWTEISSASITDFPRLSLEDMEDMTLGPYQINNAQGYTNLIRAQNPDYPLQVCEEDKNLLLSKVPSRYRGGNVHKAYVGYDSTKTGAFAITGYACTCQVGNISTGACSHVTAVVWYLAYERHLPHQRQCRSYASNLLSAAQTTLRIEDPDADDDNLDIDVESEEELLDL